LTTDSNRGNSFRGQALAAGIPPSGLLFGRPANVVASPYLLTGLATCAACHGGMIVVTKDWKRERRPFYGCSYAWHRGAAVCGNSLHASMRTTDQAVVAAIAGVLARRDIIEQAVEYALADLEPRAGARDAEQEALRARMRQLDTEREHLTAAIVQGGDLPTLVQALKEREQQRAQCRQRLDALARHPQPIARGS